MALFGTAEAVPFQSNEFFRNLPALALLHHSAAESVSVPALVG
jgi:hypothetical protein